jgi:hypothetical protein
MYPQAVDPAINSAYVIESLDGRDALFRVKLDETLARELVVSNKGGTSTAW